MSIIQWDRYPNFSSKELACKHCGSDGIREEIMEIIQGIRNDIKQPLFISSGYRCVKHPVEQEKDKPGEHTMGLAVDIIAHGIRALEIIWYAQQWGVKRVGVHQKGNPNGRFIHLGIADRQSLEFPAAIWTY